MVLYRYNVAVEPAVAGKKLTQIIRLLLESPGYDQFRDDIVTDFKSTLISRERLGIDVAVSEVQYRDEGEDDPGPRAKNYRLRIEHTGVITVAELTDYLTSTNLSQAYADKPSVLQALNIFFAHYAKSTPATATVGSSKTFSLSQHSSKCDLGAGLTAIRGFFSSVRVATGRILVNVNVSHGAFYEPISLDLSIRKYGPAHQFNRVKLEKFLKRVRVRVTHLVERKNRAGATIPRVKTIFGLASRNDGHTLDHPPRVQSFGAGAKEVEFFLNDPSGMSSSSPTGQAPGKAGGQKKGKAGKGGKGGAPGGDPVQNVPQGRYISVYEYFRSSTCFPNAQLYALLTV